MAERSHIGDKAAVSAESSRLWNWLRPDPDFYIKAVGDGRTALDLDMLVARLGIAVRRDSDLIRRSGTACEGLLLRAPSGYEIVLNTAVNRAQGMLRRERFTLAHELGHHWVDQRSGFRPRSALESEALEELCDRFANRLLVPRQSIVKWGERASRSAVSAMAAVYAVSDLYDVSFHVAAHSLAAEVPGIVFGSTPISSATRPSKGWSTGSESAQLEAVLARCGVSETVWRTVISEARGQRRVYSRRLCGDAGDIAIRRAGRWLYWAAMPFPANVATEKGIVHG